MRLPAEFYDELRRRAPIVEIVGRRVAFDRRRSNPARRDFWACCPFHQEKTPSFHVEEAKKGFFCFGCKASGDVITFLERFEGLSREEAATRVAAEAGIPLPAQETRRSSAEVEAESRKAQLARLLEKAETEYRRLLAGRQGEAARTYLARRGLRPETIERFRLGLAPEKWTHLLDLLGEEGARAEDLIAAGLARPGREGRGPVDFFRHRIMIPIRDARGALVGFGGRALDPASPAKYMNSPESALFEKRHVVFHLDAARAAARKAGRIVLVEGYLDVLALVQGGLEEAVAPLGTGVSESQLAAVLEAAPAAILLFDGDAPGRMAARRTGELALRLGRADTAVAVASLPEGKDPDDVMGEGGRQAIEAVLARALPLVDALFAGEREAADLRTPEGVRQLKARLEALARTVPDGELQRLYREAFFARWQEARGALWSPRSKGAGPARGRGGARGRGAPALPEPATSALRASLLLASESRRGELSAIERALVILMIQHPELAEHHAERLNAVAFGSPFAERVKAAVLDLVALHQGLDSGALRRHLLTLADGDKLDRILHQSVEAKRLMAARPGADRAAAEATFEDLLSRHVDRQTEQAEMAAAQSDFSRDPSEETLARLRAAKRLMGTTASTA